MSSKLQHAVGFHIKTHTNLDPLLVIDPSDHLHTHLSDLVEVWLLQADIPQDLNDSLPHAYTRVLFKDKMGKFTDQVHNIINIKGPF